jgi:uncharacterized repeat protein (TIGR01451 family)
VAEFEVTVTNPGAVTIYSVTLTDTLPTGLTYQSNSLRNLSTQPITLLDPVPLTWNLGDLTPDHTVRFTYRALVAQDLAEGVYASPITLYALDRSGLPIESPAVSSELTVGQMMVIEVLTRLPDLSDTGNLPQDLPFTVLTVLTNQGADLLHTGVVQVTLPAGVEYVPGSSEFNTHPTSEPMFKERTLTWPIGDLPVGGSVVLQYTLRGAPTVTGLQAITTSLHGLDSKGQGYTGPEQQVPFTLVPDGKPQ